MTPTSTSTTRERLVHAMSESIQRRGMNATGLTDVLRDANAPKGVLYYHFPGGKTALTVAAVDASVDALVASLDRAIARGDDLLDALGTWLERSATRLHGSSFAVGCPLATVALESTPDDTEIRAAIDRGFVRLRATLAEGFSREGRSSEDSALMAYTIVAAYEGGLLQARVSERIEPMIDACRFVLDLLRARP